MINIGPLSVAAKAFRFYCYMVLLAHELRAACCVECPRQLLEINIENCSFINSVNGHGPKTAKINKNMILSTITSPACQRDAEMADCKNYDISETV